MTPEEIDERLAQVARARAQCGFPPKAYPPLKVPIQYPNGCPVLGEGPQKDDL